MKYKKAVSLSGTFWKKPFVRIAVSLLILSILFIKLPLSELWETLGKISLRLWVLTVFAFIAAHVVGVLKWGMLINLQKKILSFLAAFRCYFAGLFANLCLPSIVGGDVIRAGLAIRLNKESERVVLGGILDRVLDTTALGIIILVGTILSPAVLMVEDRSRLFILFLLVSGSLLFLLCLVFLPLPGVIPDLLKKPLERVRALIVHLIKNPQRAVAGLGLALMIQTGFVGLNMVLGRAVGIDLPLAVWLMAWPLAKLSAMVPVSMGGLGVREVALAVLLNRFGVPFTTSVGVGLLWESVLISGGCFGGILYLVLSRNNSAREDFISAGSVHNANR